MRRKSPATELVTGWGRTITSGAVRARPRNLAEIEQLLEGGRQDPAGGPAGGIIARGLGRSYNDAAQSTGGLVIDLAALSSISEVDPTSGSVTVGAGATIASVIEAVLPSGWFVPVTPGTRSVTIGGAIAADVHGKNHHLEGSFCSHVSEIVLATPSGTRTVGPASDPGLFWATAGGMGLTGVVVRATLRLLRVETAAIAVTTERFGDLDSVMAVMDATDDRHRYSVAWIDCSDRRRTLGRAVLSRGDHASRARAGDNGANWSSVPPPPRATIPGPLPYGAIGSRTVRAFNAAWFHASPRWPTDRITSLWGFFYPLDALGHWNYLYGPAGMVQYQFAVDRRHPDVVRRAIEMVFDAGAPCPLAVLKRFGPGNEGLLSFPVEGWTLAMDFPVGNEGLPALLDRLDVLIAESGGRVYLAKDARLRPELLPVMYPRSAAFGAACHDVDPLGVMRSDLSRRLQLDRLAQVRTRA